MVGIYEIAVGAFAVVGAGCVSWYAGSRIGEIVYGKRRRRNELLEDIERSRISIRARKPKVENKLPTSFVELTDTLCKISTDGIYDREYRGSEDQKEDYCGVLKHIKTCLKDRKITPGEADSLLKLAKIYIKKDF